MPYAFGWAALAVLFTYLILFFLGGVLAARMARRAVWLFGRATGRDAWAALGFRAAFTLSLAGSMLWLALPRFRTFDPLWLERQPVILGLAGVGLAAMGAMLAFAAQMSLGASWRGGVRAGETGALVQDGLSA